MKAFMLAVGFALAVSACVGSESVAPPEQSGEARQKPLKQQRQESFDAIDVAACVEGGGEVQQDGLLGLYRCTTPYRDAGKTCRDGSDCAGRCMGDDAVTDYEAAPGEAIGVCEATDSPFGCYATIDEGTASPFICVD